MPTCPGLCYYSPLLVDVSVHSSATPSWLNKRMEKEKQLVQHIAERVGRKTFIYRVLIDYISKVLTNIDSRNLYISLPDHHAYPHSWNNYYLIIIMGQCSVGSECRHTFVLKLKNQIECERINCRS